MGKLRLATAAEKTVTIALVICGLATLIGIILMWPTAKSVTVDDTLKKSIGMNDSLVYGAVLQEGQTACDNVLFGRPMDVQPKFTEGPTQDPAAAAQAGHCPAVVVEMKSGEHESQYVVLNNRVVGDSVMLHEGNHIRMAQDNSSGQTRYVFEDMDRRTSLAVWLIVTVLIVFLAGSWKGLRAVVGVLLTLVVVVLWMLPSILSGHPVIPVAVLGSSLALFLVMFFVHGFSWKTASALLGTLISLLVAVTMSQLAVETAHITGMSEEQNVTIQMYMGQLPVVGLVIAGFIIGSIGVLNDVTISQASTVFELAEMDKDASASRVFSGAMRVGRDHISSMLYTLVLAYTGSVLPLLLLIQQSSRGMWEVLNGEVIAVEILRSVVGAITLALSFPLTNAIATWLAVPTKRAAVTSASNAVVDAGAGATARQEATERSQLWSATFAQSDAAEAEGTAPDSAHYSHHQVDEQTDTAVEPSRHNRHLRHDTPHRQPAANRSGRESYPRPNTGFQQVGDGHLVTGDGYLTSNDRGYSNYTPSIPQGKRLTVKPPLDEGHSYDTRQQTPQMPGNRREEQQIPSPEPTYPADVFNYQPRRVRPSDSTGTPNYLHPEKGTAAGYPTGQSSRDDSIGRHGRHSR